MSCSRCAKEAGDSMIGSTGVPASGIAGPQRCYMCGEWVPEDGLHSCPNGGFFAEWTIGDSDDDAVGADAVNDAGQRKRQSERSTSEAHKEVVDWLESQDFNALADIADMGGIAALQRHLLDSDGWEAVNLVAEGAHGLPPSQIVDGLERKPGEGPRRGSPEFEDRCCGMMVGMALGDALGYRVEFHRKGRVLDEHGLWGVHTPPESRGTMLYTDDTQMAVALAKGLLDADEEGSDWHDEVAVRFVQWLRDPENTRAPGGTCLAACRALEADVPWDRAGDNDSKGCGTVMRVPPVGALCRDMEYDQLRSVAGDQSDMTHGHSTARAASIACAHAVALLLKDTPPMDMLRQVYGHLKHEAGSREMRKSIAQVAGLLDQDEDEYAASRRLGSGWVAEEALSIAMWSFMRSPDDYPAVVRRAVNFAGCNGSCDRDSVGAIAGALAGAWNGMRGIPADWSERVEHRDWLLDLGKGLAKKEVCL